MQTVTVDLGARGYAVRIGRELLGAPAELLPWVTGAQACVVTDEHIAPLYLDALREALAGKQVLTHILPPGEEHKNLRRANDIFSKLLAVPCDRQVTVIALGGGVVGDLAGFVAACYQRGVPFIQIPTTLLAQVDSSVGGKTAVNHALGKNMIGAFHQPRRVLADLGTLDTLDARQFAAGLAEVIKYGVIADREFFIWLENNLPRVVARETDALEFVVQRACVNKANIVARDEREQDARALLNLGHTFAHAIETGLGYGKWLHGEAVSTGMVMAAHLSTALGKMEAAEGARVAELLAAANLPTGKFRGLTPRRMLDLMRVDKKSRAGQLRLVLPNGIGAAELTADYPPAVLRKTIAEFAVA